MKRLWISLLIANCFCLSACSDKKEDGIGQVTGAANQTESAPAKADAAYDENQKKMKDAAAKY